MRKIKVAIVGVGNCASSLVQGVQFYKDIDNDASFVPGLAHNDIMDYKLSDIEFVAAFDVDKNKVNKDLSNAIFQKPNCAIRFSNVPKSKVIVKKGPIIDGLGENLKTVVPIDDGQVPVDVSEHLKKTKTEIVVNYLPTGSTKATEYYANEAIKARCGFVNAIPDPIATNELWRKRFKEADLPVAGDDIKSQIGSTILHRALIELLINRGVRVDRTYQINSGGNTDFLNLVETNRSIPKKRSKLSSLQSLLPYNAMVSFPGPSYVEFQGDHKTCNIRIEGTSFGDIPVKIDVTLDVEDSPNSAGVVVDIIRIMKLIIDKKINDDDRIFSYFFKDPYYKNTDKSAYQNIQYLFRKSVT